MSTQLKPCPCCNAQLVVTTGMSLCQFHRNEFYRHAYSTCLKENNRAVKRGLVGDLTIEQFTVSARFFAIQNEDELMTWACAYCRRPCMPGLDHWRAISLGGGSTFTNVIPCCFDCNSMKSTMSGEEYLHLMATVLQSPVAKQAQEMIEQYWNLMEQGIDAIFRAAMNR